MAWSQVHWWWLLMLTSLINLILGTPQRPINTAIPKIHQDKSEIIVFIQDNYNCNDNKTDYDKLINTFNKHHQLSINILKTSLTCDPTSSGLKVLVDVLDKSSTKALLAATDSNTCEVVIKLAHLYEKPLLTWTCPILKTLEKEDQKGTIRLSPSIPAVSMALAEVFLHFKWKFASVVTLDEEPWLSLDKSIIGNLRSIGIIPRYRVLISRQIATNNKEIHRIFWSFESIVCRVIVLCLPGDENLTNQVLKEIETMQITKHEKSFVLLVHPFGPELFLPMLDTYSESFIDNLTTTATTKRPKSMTKHFPSQFHQNLTNLLAFAPFDKRYNIENIYNGSQVYVEPKLINYLNESLNILTLDNSSLNSDNNKMYTYGLLAWRPVGSMIHKGSWQPLVQVIESKEHLYVEELIKNNFTDEELLDIILCYNYSCYEDLDDEKVDSDIPIHTVHIIAMVMACFFLTLLFLIIILFIRRHLLNKRMSKGPYKIILTATDFVFPQLTDSRRVDEGIEAMLCCWLQQFREFGGPKIEKPDLLQGSVGSLKPHTILKDPCARYNGDLVQLKELPCQGTFELKSKAMDVLVMIHGLRHENLNPLIGCLTEPTRPCLVYEYCSRGSLEDVLVQDEIKLDWSFRLSLLTDLVRGMKYLHSSPIRVHGFLTSRNCVIDARWVLKVTDYGLPAFYEAQNIITPVKTARDLLWTAPELLRHSGLRKIKGSQPADVYSFGIIMQEVVVRGEPFCMLALSPEDIIEKVKKPPPLIRPSVSKGAAPPEAINIMRQCWAEAADMRPDFNAVHDLFKKLNHGRKVNFVDTMFQMLEKYSNNLEELIRQRTEQLDMEKKKTEQLLNRMLPSTVAEKLKLGMPVDPEEFDEVTIYFSDIVGFTTISAHSTPFQVVDLLNDLYTCFDDTINAYNVYKVETIGDAYMVVGGCPIRIKDHAEQVATMALDLLHQSGKFRVRHLPKTQLRLRIGLHTGPCCAGVVGLTMPRYCLFGDTVNTASRMESTGSPWRIHLSQATRDRLYQVGGYHIEYRGCTDVKGKGKMPTYWLLGKQGFDKQLPTPPPLGLEESLVIGRAESIERSENSDDHSEGSAVSVPMIRQKTTDEQSVSSHDDNENNNDDNDSSSDQSSYSISTTSIVNSKLNSAVERTSVRKVPVSIHDEKKSVGGSLQGTPTAVSDVATMLLGATSTTSLSSNSSTIYRGTTGRYRKVGRMEDDLSSPYNHYRCLSPNEHHGRNSGGRFLKRQFSLDRPDDSISIISESASCSATTITATTPRTAPRLYKQNSAGAANDLERIEEVPSSTPIHQQQKQISQLQQQQNYRHSTSISLSVESLTLR